MIEPEDVDRLVERTKSGELTWRPTGNCGASAESVVVTSAAVICGAFDQGTVCRVGSSS